MSTGFLIDETFADAPPSFAEVALSVYELNGAGYLNSFTRLAQLGGAYHVAVEVYWLEWSFGFAATGTGVYPVYVGTSKMGTFMKRIPLGRTKFTPRGVLRHLHELRHIWVGRGYSMLSRNCAHFSCAFVQRLGVESPPSWINSLAQLGDQVSNLLGGHAGEVAFRFTRKAVAARSDDLEAQIQDSEGLYHLAAGHSTMLINGKPWYVNARGDRFLFGASEGGWAIAKMPDFDNMAAEADMRKVLHTSAGHEPDSEPWEHLQCCRESSVRCNMDPAMLRSRQLFDNFEDELLELEERARHGDSLAEQKYVWLRAREVVLVKAEAYHRAIVASHSEPNMRYIDHNADGTAAAAALMRVQHFRKALAVSAAMAMGVSPCQVEVVNLTALPEYCLRVNLRARTDPLEDDSSGDDESWPPPQLSDELFGETLLDRLRKHLGPPELRQTMSPLVTPAPDTCSQDQERALHSEGQLLVQASIFDTVNDDPQEQADRAKRIQRLRKLRETWAARSERTRTDEAAAT